jgi:hypothetical protein
MKRRDFLVATATTPLLTQIQAFANETPGVQGFVYIKINVHNLPPHKAEAFMKRLSDQFKMPQGWNTVWRPVRDEASEFKIFKVNDNAEVTEVKNQLELIAGDLSTQLFEEQERHELTHLELEKEQLAHEDTKEKLEVSFDLLDAATERFKKAEAKRIAELDWTMHPYYLQEIQQCKTGSIAKTNERI